MNHPNIPILKLVMLAFLDTHGPQRLDGEEWDCLGEFQDKWPDHFAAFRARAISELAQDGFIVCSNGRVFLTRPLAEFAVPTNIDLATANRMGWLMNSLPEGPLFDAFHPTQRDLAIFSEVAFNAIESLRKRESEIQVLKEDLRNAKSSVQHWKNLEQQARQEINRRLKLEEEEKTKEILATHKISNGICELCGQSAQIIAEAKICCNQQDREAYRRSVARGCTMLEVLSGFVQP